MIINTQSAQSAIYQFNRPIVSLQSTQSAMAELTPKGKRPCGKLAFYNAALSAHNGLSNNCRQALIMRKYAFEPLPINRDALQAELGGCLPMVLNALYEIERLWAIGAIHFNAGTSFEDQCKWRDTMCSLIPGMGLKTVSFALLIYSPFQCQLVPVDLWHMRRYGIEGKTPRRAQYLALEQKVILDCRKLQEEEGNGTTYSIGVLAACLWERDRQACGKSSVPDGEYQSHAELSCYV